LSFFGISFAECRECIVPALLILESLSQESSASEKWQFSTEVLFPESKMALPVRRLEQDTKVVLQKENGMACGDSVATFTPIWGMQSSPVCRL
jgi:hypothetical protein